MLRRRDELLLLQEGGPSQDWVISRQFCAFTAIDAAAVPLPSRKGYLSTVVRRWSPFPETGFHAEWAGARVMVWAWSTPQVLHLAGGPVPMPRRLLPESLFRGGPAAGGAQLLAMDEGVEGRVWRDGAMVASEWWPALPDLAEWNAFRRGAGLPADTGVPEPEVAGLAPTAWTRQRSEALNDIALRHRKTLQALAVGLAVLLLAAPLAASVRLLVKTALLERVIEEEAAGVGGILQARESAERDLAAAENLLALRPPARQLQLLSTVLAATPDGARLLEWRMPDPQTLEVVLQARNADPAGLVRAWEGTGLFSDVSVELGRAGEEVTIRAKIGATPAKPLAKETR